MSRGMLTGVVVLALAVVGCGGGAPEAAPGAAPAAAVAAAGEALAAAGPSPAEYMEQSRQLLQTRLEVYKSITDGPTAQAALPKLLELIATGAKLDAVANANGSKPEWSQAIAAGRDQMLALLSPLADEKERLKMIQAVREVLGANLK